MSGTAMTTDRIEKQILLRAPRARVWRALTTPSEMSAWFRVKVTDPFKPGARVRGTITYPGYEHLKFEITIERMEPEKLFSWRWHPGAIDPKTDYTNEPTTLVEFRLDEAEGGTLLTLVESGFDKIPVERRAEAFRLNEGGWAEQMDNIKAHVETKQ